MNKTLKSILIRPFYIVNMLFSMTVLEVFYFIFTFGKNYLSSKYYINSMMWLDKIFKVEDKKL
jgi:hypothetical protein